MICATCQIHLPEQAVACWKCGTPLEAVPAAVPVLTGPLSRPKAVHDPLLIVITFFISVALFICVGWTRPFTVWGTIVSGGKEDPGLGTFIAIASGAEFIVSTIGTFAITWWGSYTIWRKMIAK